MLIELVYWWIQPEGEDLLINDICWWGKHEWDIYDLVWRVGSLATNNEEGCWLQIELGNAYKTNPGPDQGHSETQNEKDI